MKRNVHGATLTCVAIAITAIACFVPSLAMAQPASGTPQPGAGTSDDAASSAGGGLSVGTGAAAPGAAETAAPGVKKQEDESVVRAYVDATFGFGRTDVLNQRLVGPLITQEARERSVSRYATQSFLLGADGTVAPNVRVGGFIPLSTGNVYSSADERRGTTALGNVSLYGRYERPVRKDLTLDGTLTLALPTAQGEAIPAASDVSTLGHVQQSDYDRYAIQRGVAASRGREDIASFTPKHFGVVPKIGATWRGVGKLEIEAYVKYQSLHATGTNATYLGAVVAGARGTYLFHPNVDGTLRVWTDIPVGGDDVAGAAAEPQVRGHFGAVTPIVGVILPFAGRLTDPPNVGVRFALAAAF